ncbi:MAG: J domain-containing protein [Myxococcaceae bacterium]
MSVAATAARQLETTLTRDDGTAVDVECTHCGVRMTSHMGSGKQVRYFHCPSCSRWTTSVYTEVLRADTKMRTRVPESRGQTPGFGSVRERLDRWLRSLDANNPWHTLGISPDVSDAALRDRYLYLARQHHPDRGGNAEQMRAINEAYEKVLAERETRRTFLRVRALPAGR